MIRSDMRRGGGHPLTTGAPVPFFTAIIALSILSLIWGTPTWCRYSTLVMRYLPGAGKGGKVEEDIVVLQGRWESVGELLRDRS